MAISATTDWSKIRYVMLLVFATSVLLASTVATGLTTSGKDTVPHTIISRQKRQLFREHLLPQQGGKIPESAFMPDRLALNRLNQQGIYSSDGIYLEQRRPEVHYHPKHWTAETIKFTVRPDNRYVAPVGRYHFQSPRQIETTYLIREPVRTQVVPVVPFHRALPLAPHSSLKIFHRHRLNGNHIHDSSWNEIFPSNGFPERILAEFAPYLKKLHEVDYD